MLSLFRNYFYKARIEVIVVLFLKHKNIYNKIARKYIWHIFVIVTLAKQMQNQKCVISGKRKEVYEHVFDQFASMSVHGQQMHK